MEENKEVLEPQKTPEGEGTPPIPEESVTLSKTELEDIKHKAQVSSQNFERAKKAESEVKELREKIELYEAPSEENGENRELKEVKSELSEIKGKLQKNEVINSYPVLKEMWDELEEFCSQEENKGMSYRTAAKAFLIEKGLLESPRKGLEKPTSGPRTPVPSGMSAEDAERLMKTDYKKYYKQLKEGKLKIE